ncbi:MAG: hypothetical protein UZ19_OD1000169 [Parcubacteria bacterium OLB19]|nr:MAG: hypothetical protein UZ19_OD1000169 [Parcubacteria bacterium OLB19]
MKKIIWGISIGLLIVVAVIISQSSDRTASPNVSTSSNTPAVTDNFVIASLPKGSVSEVKISSVTMPEAGFVVVREVDDKRLGQIVEISGYLEAGMQENVVVTLGREYASADKLIVMLYGDTSNDQVMNDLDRPLRTENNLPIARYVSSGKVVPTDILANGFQAEAIAMMEMGQSMPGMVMPMETIRYTNEGYVPANITVKAGTMVMFVNESDQDMWVASNGHPAHTDLPTFDQFEFSPKGSQYFYTFDQVGSWKYHDHIAPVYGGVVTVTE